MCLGQRKEARRRLRTAICQGERQHIREGGTRIYGEETCRRGIYRHGRRGHGVYNGRRRELVRAQEGRVLGRRERYKCRDKVCGEQWEVACRREGEGSDMLGGKERHRRRDTCIGQGKEACKRGTNEPQ